MSTPPNDDSDLRGLLGDAVSDVHPEGSAEQIRARARRPSAARWVPITLAAAVATVVVIAGGAWLAQRQPSAPAAAPSTPDTSASPQASAEPDPTRTATVPVYYVGSTASGPRLFAESHRVADATGSDVQVAVQESLSGTPLDEDYRSLSALGVTATARIEGGAVTVDLSGQLTRPGGMDNEMAQMAVQSLVWTANAAAELTGPVGFTVTGTPVTQLLGVPTSGPVEQAGADSALSPVSITTPGDGATVSTQFDVTGQAATFEANVVWELKQGDRVVREGFTTAQECCTLSPYAFTITVPPGDYTLVVHDTDESDGEGVGLTQDTKRVTVQ
jgi:hypothetical protein